MNKPPYTEDEKIVSDFLCAAYNKFIQLPEVTSFDKQEFTISLHRLQDILNHRILKRDYPEVFK